MYGGYNCGSHCLSNSPALVAGKEIPVKLKLLPILIPLMLLAACRHQQLPDDDSYEKVESYNADGTQ